MDHAPAARKNGAPGDLITTDVDRAVEVLLAGGLVALPTETVYGLAADASSPTSVARVFAVKGRPADHPLIVHVGGPDDVDHWAREVPGYARRLARDLWPGPLTLVLPRTPAAGDHVTGGQDTVGLRAPSHPIARALIARTGVGVAAPSANRFGRVSPTTADHVLAELEGLLVPGVDVVLDGGPSTVGVESTIVDCTGESPVLLRPGSVTPDQIATVGGTPLAARRSVVRAPGTLAAHYAPEAAVRVVDQDGLEAEASGVARRPGEPPTIGVLAPAGVPTPSGTVRLSEPADAGEYARILYAALREADALGLRTVLAVPPPAHGIGAAVLDRLRRAAAGSGQRP